MKRKGFTLIELVVVIALIAILAVTLAPRLRDQIAKAGDAKAIAVLGALRTQSEIYFADNQKVIYSTTAGQGFAVTPKLALDELIQGLDASSQKLFAEGSGNTGAWVAGNNLVPIGGSVATTASGTSLDYGGTIGFGFYDNATGSSSDGISIFFSELAQTDDVSDLGTAKEFDSKRNEWIDY